MPAQTAPPAAPEAAVPAALLISQQIAAFASERALSAKDISEKFFDNASLVISRPRAERIRAAVLAMDQHCTRDFTQVLAFKIFNKNKCL